MVRQAGLGAEYFCGDMWTSSRDQITLSHYIKTLDVAPELDTAEHASVIQAAYRGKQSRRGTAELKGSRASAAKAIQRRQRRKSNPDMMLEDMLGGGGGGEGFALSDANEEVWAERIKGIKSAYVDSCTRLGSALEELEQTLCLLTGDAAVAKPGRGLALLVLPRPAAVPCGAAGSVPCGAAGSGPLFTSRRAAAAAREPAVGITLHACRNACSLGDDAKGCAFAQQATTIARTSQCCTRAPIYSRSSRSSTQQASCCKSCKTARWQRQAFERASCAARNTRTAPKPSAPVSEARPPMGLPKAI